MPGTPGSVFFGDNPFRAGQGNTNLRNLLVPVAASQTIYKGDIVSIASNVAQQSIALPGTNNTVTLSGGNLPALGLAGFAVTTDSNGNWLQPGGFTESPGMLEVYPFDDTLEVALQIWNATPGNTVLSNIALFTAYQFGRLRGANASTWKYVISTTTTNGELRYIEAWPPNDIPTTAQYNWGWFKSILSATVRQGS